MTKEITISGKKIVYHIHGKGKPLMLVHGFGETSDVWINQVEYFKDKYLLILPDLPGSGQSEMIDDMSVEGMAEVLKVILDTSPFALSKGGGWGEVGAVMLGHSMGGYVMLAFVEKYGSLLDAFGLVHSTAFPDTEEKKAARRKGIEFIKEHGAFEFLRTTSPNLFSPTTKEQSPAMMDEFINSLKSFSAAALIAYYESMIRRPDRTAVLKNARAAVLFILGKFDNAIPLQDGLKQCRFPEASHIHVLQKSGHMGMMEEAEKTNAALEAFLKGTL